MIAALDKSTWVPMVALAAFLCLGAGFLKYQDYQAEEELRERAEAREEAERAEAERARNWFVELQNESEEKIPDMLEGVRLGHTLEELREARPRARRSHQQSQELRFFSEQLANGSQVMYGFDRESDRLIQVQVMSRIPVEGLGPHLTAMNEVYGSPTGIWDCRGEGPPVRRFTWRGRVLGIADAVLLHPGGASITLFIGPTAHVGRSLERGGCQPISSRDQIDRFPVATGEDILVAAGIDPEEVRSEADQDRRVAEAAGIVVNDDGPPLHFERVSPEEVQALIERNEEDGIPLDMPYDPADAPPGLR